jgi:F420-dependent oxidoreductase-like protein
MIGVYVPASDAKHQIELIQQAEKAGVPAFWLTTGGGAPDAPTLYAAAAMVTDRIKFGTSITQTWPRHPVSLATQALALNSIAPGRFRFGLGAGHKTPIEGTYGMAYERPLTNLREYLTVLRTLLSTGEVDFHGSFINTTSKIPGAPINVPVMASALRPASFRTCGELADGAISWVSPWNYLRDTALPAMREGAAAAGRSVPPLVAHIPVVLVDDKSQARDLASSMLQRYASLPNYQGMFAAAGFDDVAGEDRIAATDAIVASGTETQVVGRLAEIMREGAGEIIAHPIYAGEDKAGYERRFFDVIAAANKEAGVSA